MALPPQLHQHPPASQKSPVSRRRRYGSSWIILCLIVGFWYVGFGWGNHGGWIWGHPNASVPAANDGELSGAGVVILEVANKEDYVGQSFQIRNVAVDHWSGNRAVWIGSRHRYLPMLLILDSPLAPQSGGATAAGDSETESPSQSTDANGQLLDVTGTVMKAPPTVQAQHQWNLNDDDVNQLEQEGVYIQATSAKVAKN